MAKNVFRPMEIYYLTNKKVEIEAPEIDLSDLDDLQGTLDLLLDRQIRGVYLYRVCGSLKRAVGPRRVAPVALRDRRHPRHRDRGPLRLAAGGQLAAGHARA